MREQKKKELENLRDNFEVYKRRLTKMFEKDQNR
jgi:hypothetical protein